MADRLSKIWMRFKKNHIALAGSGVIIFCCLIAVFAYYISPDSSPYANRMIVEIGGKKPGFTQQFLKIPTKDKTSTSFFNKIINGKKDNYYYLPISNYQWTKDSIIVEKFIDEGISERQAFNIHSVNQDSISITSITFLLGTDKFGRDILSRLIIGVRVSLGVGIVTVIISLLIGCSLGSVAGYFGGRVDDIIMWFINIIWSIPTLLLVFALTIVLGKGFWQVFVAIGLTSWVNVARIVRGQILTIRELEYIEAAGAIGLSSFRIIVRHILPNIAGPIIVIATANFATAIVIEAGLSFLGVGVQPPQPSWGLMIKENYNFIITHNPMLALAPGFAIMILVLSFNMLGNGLRDALQIKV